jgi:ABC-type amino acid transport substrate-binding protein
LGFVPLLLAAVTSAGVLGLSAAQNTSSTSRGSGDLTVSAAGEQLNSTAGSGARKQGCTIFEAYPIRETFGNELLRVSLHAAPPFVFYNKSRTGNARFSGITIDVLEEIGKIVDARFTYIIDEKEPERIQRAVDAVMDRTATLAAGAIRITANQSATVHFTLPYFDSGFLLVVRMPDEAIHLYKAFLPFHTDLWTVVGVEILFVGFALYCMEAPHLTWHKESDLASGWILGLLDGIYWSATGFIQTLDKKPYTWGGRVVMMAHGWFCLIAVASYTANLAAFLTSEVGDSSIGSWADVQEGSAVYKLGIPRSRSHLNFLRAEGELKGNNFSFTVSETYEESFELLKAGKVCILQFLRPGFWRRCSRESRYHALLGQDPHMCVCRSTLSFTMRRWYSNTCTTASRRMAASWLRRARSSIRSDTALPSRRIPRTLCPSPRRLFCSKRGVRSNES